VLEDVRGPGEAVLFARSATVGGQRMPVHWGGDSSSSFVSMAESLRAGLSLTLSGFGFWSHDIGGFEGSPDPEVFKRWVAFGLMSSHSRLHGSDSYRVPWAFDDEEDDAADDARSAVEVTRRFTRLKLELMPYLYAAGLETHRRGIPLMRAMVLEFPGDPAVEHLDRQYMLGPDLLVAPVLNQAGDVDYYLPDGTWTNLLTGEVADGGRWRRERHDVTSMPLWVREGAVLVTTPGADRPDGDHAAGALVTVYPGDADRTVEVTHPVTEAVTTFAVVRGADGVRVTAQPAVPFSARLAGADAVRAQDGRVDLRR
jgi:alpha-D-xyloside xylohydrolase